MNLDYVDLGLPSGTLWAKCNLGAEKETDFGDFFQWGDTQGYEDASEHQYNWDDYKYGSWNKFAKYNKSDKKLILDNEDDPVFVATNGEQKMPTKEQMQELIDHTTQEWTTIDGVNGTKFINKNDNTKYIFIPAAGLCYDGIRGIIGSWGSVWSASHGESGSYNAWHMYFNVDNVSVTDCSRCLGFTVRGVVVPQAETLDEIDDTDDGQPVDLGLPSGTKWMKSNIGATKPSDFGKFYQWGDTRGFSDDAEHDVTWSAHKWGTDGNLTKYNKNDGKLILDNEDDPVYVATDGRMKSPTREQLQELIDNTEHRWLRLANGVNGMKFWKKGMEEPTDGNSYIFIPAAGYCGDGSHDGVGSWGYVWSASRLESYASYVWYMYFDAGDVGMNDASRCLGFTVRGVKDSKNLHNTFTKPKEVTTEKCQVDNSEKIPIDKTIYNQLVRLGIIDSSVRADNQGNSDYAKHIIQPWSIWIDWNLNAWDADIVKRVLRTKEGDPRELDYKKIIHICNERIRQLKNGMT